MEDVIFSNYSRTILFIILSIGNFVTWYYVGNSYNASFHCNNTNKREKYHYSEEYSDCNNENLKCNLHMSSDIPQFRPLLTKGFMKYKSSLLVDLPYPQWSILIQPQHTDRCDTIVNPHIARRKLYQCLAIVTVNSEFSYNLLHMEPPEQPKKNNNKKVQREIEYNQKSVMKIGNEIPVLLNVTGFFDKVASDIGRMKLSSNMYNLLLHLQSLEHYVTIKLQERQIHPGDDVVVMVVNAGEMDLFANFACSCKINNISMRNVLVFSGSEDVLPLLESFGAIGLYHKESFASVSRNASYEYLDSIFIDMMWYKSFSVWLLLKMKYHVLFQDVDIVWYRDPVGYFRSASTPHHIDRTQFINDDETISHLNQDSIVNNHIKDKSNKNELIKNNHINNDNNNSNNNKNNNHNNMINNFKNKLQSFTNQANNAIFTNTNKNNKDDSNLYNNEFINNIIAKIESDSWGNSLNTLPPADAYLSDDGQRSLRYTPFFANSGFYYLVANDKTKYFAWSIMTAFDLLHITGSHQNIFTIRLIEGLDLAGLHTKLLSLREFPAGIKLHHDKPYMRAIRDKHEHPFMFHMCWTRNKYDKLRLFRLCSMWFVSEIHSLQLGELGKLEGISGAEELKRYASILYNDKSINYIQRFQKMSEKVCINPIP